METLPPLPQLSLIAILLYALSAFVFGLIATPWFIRFLRRNNLGKQLRVQTVDGREAAIFRKYHQDKFGTPTMGGLLIWGSILVTVLFSRLLSYLGITEFSLLQRREVYLPLFTLVMLGILGAVDDYLNIVGDDKERLKRFMPKLRFVFFVSLLLLLITGVYLWFGDISSLRSAFGDRFGLFGPLALFVVLLASIAFLGTSGTVADAVLTPFLVRQGKKKGLSVLPKISSLLLLSFMGALWFLLRLDVNQISVPFWTDLFLGWWYVPLFIFILVGTANAVNVTDGLDGLAGGLLVISFGSFAVISYLTGLTVLAGFCAVCVGAIAAFLWHNVPPALFFMGDTGSLALGGTLGVIALMTDNVLVLPLVGAVFVIEMLSVIIQLTSKRLRAGKKVFKAAPIHHHFEALEWGESKVTMRLWIIGSFCAFLGIIIAIAGR